MRIPTLFMATGLAVAALSTTAASAQFRPDDRGQSGPRGPGFGHQHHPHCHMERHHHHRVRVCR